MNRYVLRKLIWTSTRINSFHCELNTRKQEPECVSYNSNIPSNAYKLVPLTTGHWDSYRFLPMALVIHTYMKSKS